MVKCRFHPDREAVGGCYYCSRNICPECIDGNDPPICPKCREKLRKRKNRRKRKLVTGVLFAGIFILVLFLS